MSTLWKRASKNQMKLLRAVYGAVINEADAHGRIRNETQARSISKRAVGTISALWPDVLVAASPPLSGGLLLDLTQQSQMLVIPVRVQHARVVLRYLSMTQNEEESQRVSRLLFVNLLDKYRYHYVI